MRKYLTVGEREGCVNFTFMEGSNTRMVHVLPNVVLHDVLADEPEVRAKLRSCLRANIRNNCDAPVMELHLHQNIRDWIEQISDMGFEYAVVWPDGTWPQGTEFEDVLLNIVDTKFTSNWIVSGKPLNKRSENKYVEWDYDFPVVINIKQWDSIGRPHILGDSGEAVTFDINEDSMATTDPEILMPSSWFKTQIGFKNYDRRCLFLDSAIGQGLHNVQIVYNLSKFDELVEHIQTTKISEDFDVVLPWIHNNNLVDETPINLLRCEGDALSEEKLQLYTFKLLKYQIVYITNTELVPTDDCKVDFTTMILPCSGLHQFYHIMHNRNSYERIVWFDFNPYAVKWIKNVVENWDGTDFKGFVEKNKHSITNSGEILDSNIIYDPDLVDEFMEKVGWTDDEWREFMTEMRTKENIFATVDAVKQWPELVEHAGTDGEVFIQLTNIWQYEANYLNTDGLDAQLAFISLLNGIVKTNRSLYLTGDTPMGTHYRYKNIKELKGIF
ncbi:hypothetical protein N9Q27_00810 [bacterium]|nr:hypothetical protein [bacterium]